MNTQEFKQALSIKEESSPTNRVDLTPKMISVISDRICEIEDKLSTIDERIGESKYDYFTARMRREKKDLNEAHKFNKDLYYRFTGTEYVR